MLSTNPSTCSSSGFSIFALPRYASHCWGLGWTSKITANMTSSSVSSEIAEFRPNSERKRSLSRLRRLDMNPLEREHAQLGRGAARCGKAADLAARCQDAMARDDQRHRVLGHGLTDIARSLRPGPQFLCQGAVGGGVAPSDLPSGSIDPLEERVLVGEVELEP